MKMEKVKIKNIGRVITGKTPPTSKSEFFNGDYPFITPSDINDYKIRRISLAERKLSEKWRVKASNYLLPNNTICYVCIGSTVGKSCLTSGESFSNQQINALVCDETKANYGFIFYLLKNKTNEIKRITDSSGVGKGIINKTSFENLDIEIPGLPTQTRIASVLSTYDDLIEVNEKRIKALEEMAQRIYTEWFVKFKFPGHEKARMVDSGTEYGLIPEGWEVKTLSEVMHFVRGRSYSSEQISDTGGDYYIVNLKSFNRGGGFRFDGEKYYSGPVNDDQYLQQGDVVVAVTDMTNDRAVIARPARVPRISSQRVTFSADVVKMISEKIPSSFIYYCLFDHRFTEATKQKANGANVLHLKPAAILEYRTVIPSIDMLNEFEKKCHGIFGMIDVCLERNQALAKTRDLLIPQLVTGKRELKADHVKSN